MSSNFDVLTFSSPASYVEPLWRLPSRVSTFLSRAWEAEEEFFDASETWESGSETETETESKIESKSVPSWSLHRTISDYRDTALKSTQDAASWAKQAVCALTTLPETHASNPTEVQGLREQFGVIPGDWPDTRHEVIRQEEELDCLRNRISALESRTVSGILMDTAMSAAKSYLISRTVLGRFLQPEEPPVPSQREWDGSVQTDRDSTRSWADIVRRQSTLAWETYRTTKQTAIDIATWTRRTVTDMSTRIWGRIATHRGWIAANKPDEAELRATVSRRHDKQSMSLGVETQSHAMPSRETLAGTLRAMANVINPDDPEADVVSDTVSCDGDDNDDDEDDDNRSDCSTGTCDSDWYRDDEPASTAHNLALRLLRTCCSGTLDVAQSFLPKSILDAADSIASRLENLPDGLLIGAATVASLAVTVTLHSLFRGIFGDGIVMDRSYW